MARVSDLFRDIRVLVESHPLDVDLIRIEAQQRHGLNQKKAQELIALLEQEICEDDERDIWLDNQRVDKDGASTLEIDLYDKVAVLRILAKASGLLDNPDNEDKPSVIGINVRAPDVVDVEDKPRDDHEN